MFLKNARIITNDSIIEGSVEIDKGIILGINKEKFPLGEGIDLEGKYVSPGFIDMHIHGISGCDCMEDDYDILYKCLNNMSNALIKHGVTSFVPTTMTCRIERMKKIVENISRVMDKGVDGASITGIHMEGPFISQNMCGAHKKDFIRLPSVDDLEYIVGRRLKSIKVITIAPEVKNAKDFIYCMSKLGIVMSAGHTAGTYDDLIRGIDAGITHSTHLFNAMTGFHHREPGIVGGIVDSNITTEIIADGIHVHFAAIRTAIKLKGVENIALISDSSRACDMPDGIYKIVDEDVYVRSGEARLKNGNLMGSILTLDKAVINVINYCDINLLDAIKMVTSTPAKILKIDNRKGYIKTGYDADLVVFDEELNMHHAFVGGIKKY